MKDKNKDIEQEFLDINKENKYKNYIIVGILYIIVIILSVFLVIGLKNKKDEIKNNINNNPTVEENGSKNDIDMPDEKVEDDNIDIEENSSKKEDTTKLNEQEKENSPSNNFFENISSNIQEMNKDKMDELDIMNQIP